MKKNPYSKKRGIVARELQLQFISHLRIRLHHSRSRWVTTATKITWKCTMYLSEKLYHSFRETKRVLVASYRNEIISLNGEFDQLASSQSEADSKLLLHAIDARKRGIESLCVDVLHSFIDCKVRQSPHEINNENSTRGLTSAEFMRKLDAQKQHCYQGSMPSPDAIQLVVSPERKGDLLAGIWRGHRCYQRCLLLPGKGTSIEWGDICQLGEICAPGRNEVKTAWGRCKSYLFEQVITSTRYLR